MKNPIDEVCDKHGLTTRELAMLAGIGVRRVNQLREGVEATMKGRVLDAFSKLGYDTRQVVESYEQWRQEQAQKVLSRVRTEVLKC